MQICSHCDSQYTKWQGRCTECGKWGTISENIPNSSFKIPNSKNNKEAPKAPIINLKESSIEHVARIATNITEFDRTLSGGFVSGSVTLLSGEPGVGKSTLVAQIAGTFINNKKFPLYVSGEESEGQILMRLKRLQIPETNINFSNTTYIESIIAAAIDIKPSLLIIDSIQTMTSGDADSPAGTPNTVRACTTKCIEYAKKHNVPVLIIGQITKDGNVAGPKTLEHLVDTVLIFEGDKQSSYRILRPIKHRFGSTEDVGFFEMTQKGLESVTNPSAKFLEEKSSAPGSVITCILEGNRPLLIEVQALVDRSVFANPVRRTSGFDSGRLQMLLAILGKRGKCNLSSHDVYVNVVGGIKIKEQAADLAVCAAILSSFRDKSFEKDTVIFGELGLGGEVRSVSMIEKRLKEATRLGLSNSLSPKNIKNVLSLSDLIR